jgi:hypothetical protein
VAGLWIAPQGVLSSLSFELAAMFSWVLQESTSFHCTTTTSRIASSGTLRRASCRRSSRIKEIASTKCCRHSSTVPPLSISARNLRTVAYEPLLVLLDNRRKFIVHGNLPPLKMHLKPRRNSPVHRLGLTSASVRMRCWAAYLNAAQNALLTISVPQPGTAYWRRGPRASGRRAVCGIPSFDDRRTASLPRLRAGSPTMRPGSACTRLRQ